MTSSTHLPGPTDRDERQWLVELVIRVGEMLLDVHNWPSSGSDKASNSSGEPDLKQLVIREQATFLKQLRAEQRRLGFDKYAREAEPS